MKMNVLVLYTFFCIVCVCTCKSVQVDRSEITFSCTNAFCIIPGHIYQGNAIYIARTLFVEAERVEIERFDATSLLDLSNLPNVTVVEIKEDSYINTSTICDQIINNGYKTLHIWVGTESTDCQGNEFTAKTVGESSPRSISVTQGSTSKIPKTRSMTTINDIILTSQNTNEDKTSKVPKTRSMSTINGNIPTSQSTNEGKTSIIQKTRSMTTINDIIPTFQNTNEGKTSKIQKTRSMTTINGIIPTSHSTNDTYKLAVIGTGAVAFLSIVAAMILGICLKCRLIEFKKITVGGVGIKFRDSRRHILDETELSNINTTSTSSTQPKSIELELQSSTSSTQPKSSIELELQSSTVEEIQHSTPVSSRTRSKRP